MPKYRIFISSVQKELEPERQALFSLISTDPFLKEHCIPILFEKQSPPIRPAEKPYLRELEQSHIYILMIDREYGLKTDRLSATHHEYNLARKQNLPSLALIKDSQDEGREMETRSFISIIKKDKFTYKRFIDRIDLKKEVYTWLKKVLKEQYGLIPSREEEDSGVDTIEAASTFELQQQMEVPITEFDREQTARLYKYLIGKKPRSVSAVNPIIRMRGLVWLDTDSGTFCPTAGGVIFLGKNPGLRYPHCQVQADAYPGIKRSGRPSSQKEFTGPIPLLIEKLLDFVNQNTEHPTRIIGIHNVELNEYPEKAVREALVNAFAHRDYEDTSRKIQLNLFPDRLVVASPGYPPKPVTLAKLRKGDYESCRRNPIIAECLAAFSMMEQRGTGFERMRTAMLDHGLETPSLDQKDGYFRITLHGPAGDFDRIRISDFAPTTAPPSIESQLNERQKAIIVQVHREGFVTNNWCREHLKVVSDTAHRDLRGLVDLKILERTGKGRATRYVLAR